MPDESAQDPEDRPRRIASRTVTDPELEAKINDLFSGDVPPDFQDAMGKAKIDFFTWAKEDPVERDLVTLGLKGAMNAQLLEARPNREGLPALSFGGPPKTRVRRIRDFDVDPTVGGKVWTYVKDSTERIRTALREVERTSSNPSWWNRIRGREDEIDDTSSGTSQADPYLLQDFVPVSGGPLNKNLFLADMLAMQARAFQAKTHNAIANRIVSILTQYSLGKQTHVKFTGPQAQQRTDQWEEYVEETNLHQRLRVISDEITTYGETIIRRFPTRPANTQIPVSFRALDPSTIWEILHHPEDPEMVYGYWQIYPTVYFLYSSADDPMTRGLIQAGQHGSPYLQSKYVMRQIPATDVLHVKQNATSGEKRGRSLIFPSLFWLREFKNALMAEILRCQVSSSYVFDDTIMGSDSDVANYMNQVVSRPGPATVFAHTDSVKRQVLGSIPYSSAAGMQAIAEMILSMISASVGIPKEHLNLSMRGGGGSRATALVGAEPFTQVIYERQGLMERTIRWMVRSCFPGIKSSEYEVSFPEVATSTTTEKLQNLAIAEGRGWISHERSAAMAAGELQINSFDYTDENAIIAAEKQAGVSPVPPPMVTSGGFLGQMAQRSSTATKSLVPSARPTPTDLPIKGDGADTTEHGTSQPPESY